MRKLLCSVLLGFGFAFLVLAAPGLAQSPGQPALVRIDLTSPEDPARVAALDLPVYAHLTAPGADYLLAVLTPQQQAQLGSLGFTLTVLDPDAEDVVYYLIESGQPQMAERVAPAFVILHDDGRQAVGRRQGGIRMQAIDSLDVRAAPLGPDPIVLTPRVTGDIPSVPVYDPLVAELLTQITTGTLAGHVGGLSGEQPVLVGGQPYVLSTRYTYIREPIARATQYVYEYMQALGYDVRYHDYVLAGYALRNVIGEKRGLVHPDRIVILTAHLDSRAASAPHNPAPGADDNGSGSAALMTAADLLADLDFAYTVRIVFFTGEEQGMWGSYYYARDVASAGEDILGVLNLDMIAWDAKGGPAIDLHSWLPNVEDDSDALADLFAAVVDMYGLGLEPQIVESGARFSDHARFWDRGYAALLVIEDYYNASEQPGEPRDWNANYHTANDRLGTLNLGYFREAVRASLATFIHLARPMRSALTFTVNGVVTDAASGLPLSATVQFGGDPVIAAPTGFYSATVFSGTYVMAVSAPLHYPVTRTVVVDRDMRQDFALLPTPCVLVVDDDYDDKGNRYDDQAYYTSTLEALSVGYDVWSVPDDRNGPALDVLGRYRGVVWLTGRDWDYTLTSADQGALTAYLEGGGRLFLSGQDIGWDVARRGEPPFYRDYLHADYLRDDSGYRQVAGAGFLSGVNVTIQGGDGANNQKYPSDVAVFSGGVGLFRYPDGDWAATAYDGGTYRLVYLAFGFEGINSAADRHAVMEHILNYLAPCLP